MVANHPSGFFDLAAAPRQPLAVAAWPTSPRKTRVRGFRRRSSGQTSGRGRCRSMFTPGLRGCGYKTVSGRHEWLSRDPLAEEVGLNLYEYVGDDPINSIDPLGLCDTNSTSNAANTVARASSGGGGGASNDPIFQKWAQDQLTQSKTNNFSTGIPNVDKAIKTGQNIMQPDIGPNQKFSWKPDPSLSKPGLSAQYEFDYKQYYLQSGGKMDFNTKNGSIGGNCFVRVGFHW